MRRRDHRIGQELVTGGLRCQRRLVLGALAARLVVSTEAAAATGQAARAERVLVEKGERRLHLLRHGQAIRSFRVALGRRPRGTKLYQGDGRTPEGHYRLVALNADSHFYRSIRISYPNEQDLERARGLGLPAGGDIMIHGLAAERRHYGAGHWRFNWTNGCIAVTDREIDEIWPHVTIGMPIEIRP